MFRRRQPPPSTINPIPPSSLPSRSPSPSLPFLTPPIPLPLPPPKPPNYQSKPSPSPPRRHPLHPPPISPPHIPKTRQRPGTAGTSGTEAALALQTRQISAQLKQASRTEKAYRTRKRAAAARANYAESKDHLRQAWLHFALGIRLMLGVVKSSAYVAKEKKYKWQAGREEKKAAKEQEKQRKLEERTEKEGRVERSPVDSDRLERARTAEGGDQGYRQEEDVISDNEVEIGDGEKQTEVMVEKELPTPKEEDTIDERVQTKRWKGKGRAKGKGRQ
ncbi:hypothetical protein QC762_602605 [Podospora pseudocomata]|uniref:Pinin/SDK/MemA protein domain-containing protein n=1 Tax=Podospora pseudocomata TaxID=2093779 RepID=A0ABR0G739_9PEZI|nr:hypothetical protein QC762_602605 [Podospora pseudocomata]